LGEPARAACDKGKRLDARAIKFVIENQYSCPTPVPTKRTALLYALLYCVLTPFLYKAELREILLVGGIGLGTRH
jgi:hypothetical protein